MLQEIKNRFQKVNYTLKHRKAFRKVEKELFGKVSFSSYFHDLDKIFLYPILGIERSHNFHRNHSRHHKMAKTDSDFRMMVIDWECARYTKPDKPLNAYDTLYKFYPELEDKILPILKNLKIDHKTKIE